MKTKELADHGSREPGMHRYIGRCGHGWDRKWGDDPYWCPSCAKSRGPESVAPSPWRCWPAGLTIVS
jgi:hypothetical protein